jgi:hypothetical protein
MEAEEPSVVAFFVGDGRRFNLCQEIRRTVLGECGLAEMRIVRDEVFCGTGAVGKVALAPSGEQYPSPGLAAVIQHHDSSSAFGGLGGTHQSRRTAADDDHIGVYLLFAVHCLTVSVKMNPSQGIF